ncbi:hypothetical protein Tco_1528606, partial [Tanacetum coccineum]
MVHNFFGVMEVEHDIENMTLEDYLKYEPKRRKGKGNPNPKRKGDYGRVSDPKLPPLKPCFQTSQPYTKSDFASLNKNDEVDIDRLEDVLDDLFKIGVDNLRRMKQDEVQVKERDEGK